MTIGIAAPDPSALLRELRSMAADVPAGASLDRVGAGVGGAEDFAALLSRAVDGVNTLQSDASSLAEAFERGDSSVSLAQVMVASQKAGIAFQALAEVRNRFVRAYQDVMSMPI